MAYSHAELADRFRYKPGTDVRGYATDWDDFEDPKDHLRDTVDEFSDLQEKLYADDRHSLLLIFQGMDAAGKDSTIKKVTTGVNPAGFHTQSFKAPTYIHNDHNFLWRHWAAMPPRGQIGIFNRSYYEEVLVVKVHPEIIEGRKMPNKLVNDAFWEQRYADFRGMESHLHANGTTIVKFFLNVSKEEQRKRLLARLDRAHKHWKFNFGDVEERAFWDDYQAAFDTAIQNTHTDYGPWYVIPADDKPRMRAIVASVIVDTLNGLGLDFPVAEPDEIERFDEARRILEADG